MVATVDDLPFRPRARILQLLGEELIGSPRLAVFELVKNAYDADASTVDVTMSDLDSPNASITVQDNGVGMTREIIEQVWLVPGHDHRTKQRREAIRTPKGRLPLGEKGLGRFAVHKLGNVIELVTRAADSDEVTVLIDWDDLIDVEFLEDALVNVKTRTPQVFVGTTGTRITVRSLRSEAWSRGEVRRLAGQVTSISSPFKGRSDDFSVTVTTPGHPEWLDRIPSVTSLLGRAPWRFDFTLIDNEFEWTYKFLGVPGVGAEPRTSSGRRQGVLLDMTYGASGRKERDERPLAKPQRGVISSPSSQLGIGPISGTFYAFDRDKAILAKMADPRAVENYLDENGGVRIYRDGIRVYNYGEPDDDWLGLDIRRVNVPSKRLSRNILIGAIDLDLELSVGLREKTNREGFIENDEMDRLQSLVLGAIAAFEIERNDDKEILRKLTRRARTAEARPITVPLRKLSRIAKRHGISDEVEPLLAATQRSYDDMREILLRTGVSGLTLAVVFHEIDQGVRLVQKSIEGGGSVERVIAQTRELLALLDGFGELLRRGDIRTYDLSLVLERAVNLNKVRLRNHAVKFTVGEPPDQMVLAKLPLGLTLGAITNMVDNSIYWLRTKWTDDFEEGSRRVYARVDNRLFSGPAIVFADNGPGTLDDLSELTRPFFSRRPDGIGIGLYYVNMILNLIGGSLVMPTREEAMVPAEFNGAVFALVFERG